MLYLFDRFHLMVELLHEKSIECLKLRERDRIATPIPLRIHIEIGDRYEIFFENVPCISGINQPINFV